MSFVQQAKCQLVWSSLENVQDCNHRPFRHGPMPGMDLGIAPSNSLYPIIYYKEKIIEYIHQE